MYPTTTGRYTTMGPPATTTESRDSTTAQAFGTTTRRTFPTTMRVDSSAPSPTERKLVTIRKKFPDTWLFNNVTSGYVIYLLNHSLINYKTNNGCHTYLYTK